MTMVGTATPGIESGSSVAATIDSLGHIATLPEVTLRVIELVESSKSTAQDLHRVISCDPALTSRILKVVNSAFYGLPRQVGSIERAIVLLGLNAIKNIAIASSLAKLYRGGDLGPHFSARALWTHSLATASACRLLAQRLNLNMGDEAFLAGLIHDIGLVVELQTSRRKLALVFESMRYGESGAPITDLRDVERGVFGADHQDFGRALCEAWNFPRNLAFAAGFHHDPLSVPAMHQPLTTLVHIGDILAARGGFGFTGDLTSLDPLPDALSILGANADLLKAVSADLPQAFSMVESTFSAAPQE
jgi:HD-like signal output (HDOD) protein